MPLRSCTIPTPLGEMLAVASPAGLCLLEFVGQKGVERELAQVRGELARVQEQGAAELAAARKEHAEGVAAQRAQHDAEVGRLKDAHQQALHDQKQRSVEVIGKLETSKQRMEAELDEARKEARDAAAQLGRVTGELDALRSQVASQEATIRGFTAKKADKT